MSYASLQDLVDRFGERELIQLTDRHNQGVIDEDVAARALGDAGAEIDGYLGGRYALPLEHAPPALTRVACDLARYHLYDEHAPETITRRYEDALKFLRSLGRGELTLGPDALGNTAEHGDGAQMESGGRLWDRGESEGYL